ncbi:MAG: hypothetical protein R2724_30130 [Bryobacterales bacterium]
MSSDQSWLNAERASGNAGDNLAVFVDPSGLAPGSYGGRLTLHSEFGVERTVRVQLYVTDRPEVFAMPEELSFEHDVSVLPGGTRLQSGPQSRAVFIGALNAPSDFTVSTDAPWLAASPSGSTPDRITVTAAADGMAVGDYTGSVRITPQDTSRGPVTIPVNLSVIASRGVQVPQFLVNAATMERRPVAPGSLVTGFWDNPFASSVSASGLPFRNAGRPLGHDRRLPGALQLREPQPVQRAVADGPWAASRRWISTMKASMSAPCRCRFCPLRPGSSTPTAMRWRSTRTAR